MGRFIIRLVVIISIISADRSAGDGVYRLIVVVFEESFVATFCVIVILLMFIHSLILFTASYGVISCTDDESHVDTGGREMGGAPSPQARKRILLSAAPLREIMRYLVLATSGVVQPLRGTFFVKSLYSFI